MKVSVVTVCRNALDMLKCTMESVMEQTFGDMEYIVVDGASTDGTVEFLKKYDEKHVKWVSEPDKGIYDAMNKGVAMASGEMVIFMNAGDRFCGSETLQRMINDVSADAEVVYGDVVKEQNGDMVCKKAEAPQNSHRMYFCHQSAMTRRDLLIKFPFDIKHKYSADFKFFKQVYLAGARFVQLPYPVAIFDTNGVSNTRRSAGLHDNIRVVCEVDGWLRGGGKLIRLLVPWVICKVRGK